VHTRLGEPSAAAVQHQAALRLAREAGHGKGTVLALLGLAEADLAAGRPGTALTGAAQALEAARRNRYALLEGDALAAAAAAALACGDREAAADHARQALEVHRRIGRPHHERLAQRLLDQASGKD
jgi:hypothetical protein